MCSRAFFDAAADDLVEQEFGIAVDVQRFFQLPLFAEGFAFAVNGRAGGVEEGDAFVLTPVQEVERVLVVGVHHVFAVVVHGVGTRAFVEYGFDVVKREDVFAHLADEFVFVQIMRDVAVGQIFEFLAVAQVIHRHDVADAARVQSFDDVAADKAGGTGYDDGHVVPLYRPSERWLL